MPTPEFPPEVAERMRSVGRSMREKLASGERTWTPHWDLVGKQAIVQPGQSVVVRFLPRWDFADRWTRGADGKAKANPAYVLREVFVVTQEHWFDTPDGRRSREWCRKAVLGADEACPGCESAEFLLNSGNADDRSAAKSMRAQDVCLFNAAVGNPRRTTDTGLVDIRWIGCPMTIASVLLNYMSGGETQELQAFARGDITDHREGYDIALTRPRAQGERWQVACATKPSMLFQSAQADAFKSWWMRLVDLPDMLARDTKGYAEFYEVMHGVRPSDAPAGGQVNTQTTESPEGDFSAGDFEIPNDGPGTDFESEPDGVSPDSDPMLGGGGPDDGGIDTPAPAPARSPRPSPRPAPPSRPPARGRATRR